MFGDILVIIAMTLIMFLPTFIASSRDHKYTKRCFWINLLLGWSVIAWLPLLIWSLVSKAK